MALQPARRPEGTLAGGPSRFLGIEEVAPLMETANKAILEDAIQYGLTMDDVELRSLCRLFRLDDIPKEAGSGHSPEPTAGELH